MQQLALQQSISHSFPKQMKAIERDARDPNHPTGSDGFSLTSSSSHIKAKELGNIKPLEKTSQSAASTGDVVEPALNIAGGFIMGGPIGAITAAAGEVFEMISGDSVLGHVASIFTGAAPATTTTAALTNANRAYLKAGDLIRK